MSICVIVCFINSKLIIHLQHSHEFYVFAAIDLFTNMKRSPVIYITSFTTNTRIFKVKSNVKTDVFAPRELWMERICWNTKANGSSYRKGEENFKGFNGDLIPKGIFSLSLWRFKLKIFESTKWQYHSQQKKSLLFYWILYKGNNNDA